MNTEPLIHPKTTSHSPGKEIKPKESSFFTSNAKIPLYEEKIPYQKRLRLLSHQIADDAEEEGIDSPSKKDSPKASRRVSEKQVLRKNFQEIALSKNGSFIWAYFFINGYFSIALIYIVVMESDYINKKFVGYNFNFYSYLPNYASVPFGILLSKWLSRFHMDFRIFFTCVLATVSSVVFCLVTTETTTGNLTSSPKLNLDFLWMMFSFFFTCIFLVTFQSNIVCISTIYGSKYTVLFYLAQPIANLFFTFFRQVLILLGVGSKLDVIFYKRSFNL